MEILSEGNDLRSNLQLFEDFGAKSMYLRQGYVITSHSLLWDVITYPCLSYLLLAPKSSFICTHMRSRDDFRFAPSQWETALLCNYVSHWLGASLASALRSGTHFEKGLLTHKWHLTKIIIAVIMIRMIKSGHKFAQAMATELIIILEVRVTCILTRFG